MNVTGKYIFFGLDEERFTIPVDQVISIEKTRHLTAVPKASRFIRGITDIRNVTTAIIELKYILDLPLTKETDDTRIIVVQMDNMQVGLIVDEPTEVRELNENDIYPAPKILENARDTYLRGVVKVDDALVLVLDLKRILDISETTELKNIIKQEKD